MKIALIGLGKMGKMITKIAPSKGFCLVDQIKDADVCIEFTRPECALDNIKRCVNFKKNMVVGTTGWDQHCDEVKKIVSESGIGLLYGANFSVGLFLFKECLQRAAELVNCFEEYDIAGVEYHHNKKRDQPSGTALELSQIIQSNIDRVETLQFSSIRCGSIPGTHIIHFDSEEDGLEIKHQAKNRLGFAKGALLAARFIHGKMGLYTFEDCMREHAY